MILETGGTQSSRNLGRLEKDEVQARLDSPQFIDVPDFAAQMKCEGKKAAGCEDSPELPEHGRQLGGARGE